MQWAASTEHDLFGARKMDFVNPVRASVWKDSEFRDRISKAIPAIVEQHDVSAPGAKIYFTAQPLFFDLTTEWAASLQKMVAKEVSVDEGPRQARGQHQSSVEASRPRLMFSHGATFLRTMTGCRSGTSSSGPAACRERLNRRRHEYVATAPNQCAGKTHGEAARPALAALPLEPAGIARLRSDPRTVRYRRASISLQRYRLNLPHLRGFIGVDNYIDFLSDPAFWNTFRISLIYTALTVVLELLLGLAIALLLRRPTRFHNAISIVLLAAADDGACDRGLDVEAHDQSELRHPVISGEFGRRHRLQMGLRPGDRPVYGGPGRCLGHTPFMMILCLPDCARCRPSHSRRRRSTACRQALSSSASRFRCWRRISLPLRCSACSTPSSSSTSSTR